MKEPTPILDPQSNTVQWKLDPEAVKQSHHAAIRAMTSVLPPILQGAYNAAQAAEAYAKSDLCADAVKAAGTLEQPLRDALGAITAMRVLLDRSNGT